MDRSATYGRSEASAGPVKKQIILIGYREPRYRSGMYRPILAVVSGRPHLMKLAALKRALKNATDRQLVIADLRRSVSPADRRSEQQLGIDALKSYKASGDGVDTQHDQISSISNLVERTSPSLIIVFGDLDGSVSGAVAGRVTGVRVLHVESGLRSLLRNDPEEHNRVILDELCDYHTTHQENARVRMQRNRSGSASIFVGVNPITACLAMHHRLALQLGTDSRSAKQFVLAAIHRFENVNSDSRFRAQLDKLAQISESIAVQLLLYRDTMARVKDVQWHKPRNIQYVEAMDYYAYIQLLDRCRAVLTDSSGILDEAHTLDKPAVLLRPQTHRTMKSDTLRSDDPRLESTWLSDLLAKPATRSPSVNVDEAGLVKLGEFVATAIGG